MFGCESAWEGYRVMDMTLVMHAMMQCIRLFMACNGELSADIQELVPTIRSLLTMSGQFSILFLNYVTVVLLICQVFPSIFQTSIPFIFSITLQSRYAHYDDQLTGGETGAPTR